MLQNFKQKLISKIFPILLVAAGVVAYFGTSIYWQNTCPGGGCSANFMSGVLEPVKALGLMTIVVAAPFLFLPQHYFTAWCKWLALPIIAVTTLVVTQGPVSQTQAGIFVLHRADVVEILTWFWLALTLLFVFVHYRRSQR